MIESRDLPPLPEGWVWTKVGELIEPSNEKGDPTKLQEMAYIGLEHIEKNSGKLLRYGHSSDVRSTKTRFYTGDLLYGKLRPYLNKVHVADFDGVCSTDILVFSKTPFISNKYLLYRFLNADFVRFASQNVSGVQHPRVNFKTLSKYVISLPPLPEQHRIVSKIEELFTKLDAGIVELKRVKAQLKRYRQSVLKYAFEGKLTEEWRVKHMGELEPASILLERIKEERKKNAKGKYKELPPVDTSELPELPEGWVFLTLDYLASNEKNSIKRGPFGSAIRKEFFVPAGYKVYEQKNVIYNDFKRGDYFINEQKFNELIDFEVKTGDVLMSCSGTVGKIAIVPKRIQQGIINQALLKISLDDEVISTPYFVYLFRSKIDEIILKNTRGSAMVNISSVKDLKQIPFPNPSKIEQVKIVEEIERRFSVADAVENIVDQNLKQADRLRQSILKRAFEGKLVPQDPTDEPASVLLERIIAEKENRKKKMKPKPIKKTKRKRDLVQVQKQTRFNNYV